MLDVVLELASSEALLSCIEEGVGVGFLSDRTAARALAAGTVAIVDLEDVDLTRTFSVGLLRGRPISPAAHAFVNWLESGYPATFAPSAARSGLGSSA
jgi:DNA-binding transcriptional LysR family regulator